MIQIKKHCQILGLFSHLLIAYVKDEGKFKNIHSSNSYLTNKQGHVEFTNISLFTFIIFGIVRLVVTNHIWLIDLLILMAYQHVLGYFVLRG